VVRVSKKTAAPDSQSVLLRYLIVVAIAQSGRDCTVKRLVGDVCRCRRQRLFFFVNFGLKETTQVADAKHVKKNCAGSKGCGKLELGLHGASFLKNSKRALCRFRKSKRNST
jgi:hypothetical protein